MLSIFTQLLWTICVRLEEALAGAAMALLACVCPRLPISETHVSSSCPIQQQQASSVPHRGVRRGYMSTAHIDPCTVCLYLLASSRKSKEVMEKKKESSEAFYTQPSSTSLALQSPSNSPYCSTSMPPAQTKRYKASTSRTSETSLVHYHASRG